MANGSIDIRKAAVPVTAVAAILIAALSLVWKVEGIRTGDIEGLKAHTQIALETHSKHPHDGVAEEKDLVKLEAQLIEINRIVRANQLALVKVQSKLGVE